MFTKPHITIYPSSEEYLNYLELPKPATENIPNWFKKSSSYYTKGKSVDENNDPTSTIKKCLPVVDSMTAGYHINLPCDVWIEKIQKEERTGVNIKWSMTHLPLVELHKKEQLASYPISEEYEDVVFKWLNPWIIQTKKGWSTLFIQPLHHPEIPFTCFSGLVDTDKFPIPINFPFLVKKNFEGLIPKGTPIIQMIPVKREKISCQIKKQNNQLKTNWFKASSVFFNIYKNFFHQKKTYKIKENKCPFSSILVK